MKMERQLRQYGLVLVLLQCAFPIARRKMNRQRHGHASDYPSLGQHSSAGNLMPTIEGTPSVLVSRKVYGMDMWWKERRPVL